MTDKNYVSYLFYDTIRYDNTLIVLDIKYILVYTGQCKTTDFFVGNIQDNIFNLAKENSFV